MGVLILVGTRKGLFLLRGDEARRNWQLEEPVLPGWSVYHATFDPRDGSLYAAANNFVYGATGTVPMTSARRGSARRASACPGRAV